jgi:hypothetical protein
MARFVFAIRGRTTRGHKDDRLQAAKARACPFNLLRESNLGNQMSSPNVR